LARQPSKIMTVADKKAAQAGLGVALKNHNAATKAVLATQKAADAALAAAAKAADARVKAVTRANATARKEADKLVKDAKKIHDAATAKTAKSIAAAAKGTAKITGQIAALESVQTRPDIKVPRNTPVQMSAPALTALTATAGTA